MRRIIILPILFVCFLFCSDANAQYYFDWVRASEGSGKTYNTAVAIDTVGNVYELGRFDNTVDLDPGSGVASFTSNGEIDIFVRKLSPTGDFIWAYAMGGESYNSGADIAVDHEGNIIITGYFEDSIDFDPGPSDLYLFPDNYGTRDGFVQKVSSDGDLMWVHQIGGTGSDQFLGLDTDENGNIYITGSFRNTVDFDPGPGVANLTSDGADAFVLQLKSDGSFGWVEMMTGDGTALGRGIDVGPNGELFVTGGFVGDIDFDPGVGVLNFTSLGIFDIFIEKMDTAGNWFWAKSMGNTGYDFGWSCGVDQAGGVTVTGEFEDTVDFDPNLGVFDVASGGEKDVFVFKLDAAGDLQWVNTISSPDSDRGFDLVIDSTDNIIVTGAFEDVADFDPGPGVLNLAPPGQPGSRAAFSWVLSPTGDLVWAGRYGSSGYTSTTGTKLALDKHQNVFLGGSFTGTCDFDPGSSFYNATSSSSKNTFILKLNKCQTPMGTDVQIACDSLVWIDGNTYTSSNNTATHTLTNANGCDSIISLDLTILNSNTGVDVQTACDSFTWIDGNTYTSSNNTATWVLTNVVGCDSVVTLDLTIIQSTTSTDVQVACDSLVWIDGNTYTASNNTATHTLTNAVGCDSIISLDLTILNSNTGVDVQTACDSFTWIDGNTYTSSNNTATWVLTNAAGCDSTVTLDLTLYYATTGIDTRTECDSLVWIDGNTYTSSNNTAVHTVQTAMGCDSVVTLDLTIIHSTTGVDVHTACGEFIWVDGSFYTSSSNTTTITLTNAAGCDSIVTLDLTILPMPDVNVTQSGSTLTSDQSGATYQWLDCDDSNAGIMGETGQSFTPTPITGNYSVEVNLDGCIDTSSCYLVDYTGISDLYKDQLSLSPNPVKDVLSIEGLDVVENLLSLELVSAQGKLIHRMASLSSQLDVSNLISGVYFIRIAHKRGVENLRFIKE